MSQPQEESDHSKGAFPVGSSQSRIIYRAMREDSRGGPMIGPTARSLGVRPGVDIRVVGGQVQPTTGGMSVAPDRPENLHPLRLPRRFGGSGKDPVWYTSLDLLGADLQFREDSPVHGLIEPARAMSVDDFQQLLARTKPIWKKLL